MSLEQRHLDLISAAVDGERLDAEQSAELESLLAGSAAARKLKDDLERVDTALRSIPSMELPAELQQRLLRQIPVSRQNPGKAAWQWLKDLRPGAGLRYALAASAGALVVALIFNGPASIDRSADPSALVGTMIPNSARNEPEVIASYEFRVDSNESRIELQRYDDALLLDVRIVSGTPLDLAIGLADTGLEPDAIAQFDGSVDSIAMSGDEIRLRAMGKQQVTILLRRAGSAAPAYPAEIALEFSSEDQVLERGSIPTGR
jgi:hypothetical protein